MSRRLVDEDDLSDQRLYTDEEIHVFYGQLVERLKAEGVYREAGRKRSGAGVLSGTPGTA